MPELALPPIPETVPPLRIVLAGDGPEDERELALAAPPTESGEARDGAVPRLTVEVHVSAASAERWCALLAAVESLLYGDDARPGPSSEHAAIRAYEARRARVEAAIAAIRETGEADFRYLVRPDLTDGVRALVAAVDARDAQRRRYDPPATSLRAEEDGLPVMVTWGQLRETVTMLRLGGLVPAAAAAEPIGC